VRISRIEGRVFQQAQTPVLRCLGMAATAQPVAPIVRVASQVFPRERGTIQVQDVEIGSTGLPVIRGGLPHDAASCSTAGLVATGVRGSYGINDVSSHAFDRVAVSRPIGSPTLYRSSECDGRASDS